MGGILSADRKTHLVFETLGINDRPFVPFRNEIERYPNYDASKEDLALLFELVSDGTLLDERPDLKVTRAFSKHRFSVTEEGKKKYLPIAWNCIKRYRREYTSGNKPRSDELQHYFANHFDIRRNIIVPNVSYGLLPGHEADLLILSKTGYATEVEIKVSMTDLKKDKEKMKFLRHTNYTKIVYNKDEMLQSRTELSEVHHSKMIQKFWYGITTDLFYLGALEHIPELAGVIVYGDCNTQILRQPKKNPDARKLTPEEREKLLHLGVMRTWNTRSENNRLKLQNTVLQQELTKLKATIETTRGLTDSEGNSIKEGKGDNSSGE